LTGLLPFATTSSRRGKIKIIAPKKGKKKKEDGPERRGHSKGRPSSGGRVALGARRTLSLYRHPKRPHSLEKRNAEKGRI